MARHTNKIQASRLAAVREIFYDLHRASSKVPSIDGSVLRFGQRPNDGALGRPG